MGLEQIIANLRDDDIGVIAAATGIPYETLRRIRSGQTPDPRVKTVERIAAYYADRAHSKPPRQAA